MPKGKPVAAIVLEGSDPYLREMCRNKIIESYVPEPTRDWAVARIAVRDGDWSEMLRTRGDDADARAVPGAAG